MKKLVLLFAFVVLASTASFAQFRAGFMFDYGMPMASGNEEGTSIGISDFANGGIGGRLMARYAVTEAIDLGVEYGYHTFVGVSADDEMGVSAGLSGISSYQVTGDYYFSANRFAPYAGVGVGFATVKTAMPSLDFGAGFDELGDLSLAAGTGFALSPRVGFKFGAFNFDVTYNLIMGSASEDSLAGAIAGEASEKVSLNYSNLNFGIGFIFGSRD